MNEKNPELTKDLIDTPDSLAVPQAELAAELTEEELATGMSALSELSGHVEPEPEPVMPPELPGDRLAERRVELRWSIDEAAAKLKLAPRQIAALEANDFASLPGMAVVRGFIRSYAKLLGLDPAPLVEMIASEPNPAFDPMVLRRPLPSMGFAGRRYASGIRHRGNAARRMTGLAALVLIFLLILAFAGRQMGWLTQLPFLDEPTAETTAPTGEVLIAEPLPELSASAITVSAPASTTTPIAPALVPNASVDSSRALEIKLREDAWVEMSNLNGVKLMSRMMRAGTTEKFEIKEPAVVVIRNASGVDVRMRGQSLNLKAAARDNVSTLNIK